MIRKRGEAEGGGRGVVGVSEDSERIGRSGTEGGVMAAGRRERTEVVGRRGSITVLRRGLE